VPLGAPAIYRNIRRWLASIGIALGPQGAAAPSTTATPATGDTTAEPAPVA
jgi:hypothetical protein